MKPILIPLAVAALSWFGATLPVAADCYPHHQASVRIFLRGYAPCGDPIYVERIFIGYDRCGDAMYETRVLPIEHRCDRYRRDCERGHFERGRGHYEPERGHGWWR